MLAQNFKSAADLGITESQLSALQKTLVMLETGKLRHFDILSIPDRRFEHSYEFSGDFNMGAFHAKHECGTACCIAGTAELISGAKFIGESRSNELDELFYMNSLDHRDMEAVTPSQAATALRSYLTTGDARWDLAVA